MLQVLRLGAWGTKIVKKFAEVTRSAARVQNFFKKLLPDRFSRGFVRQIAMLLLRNRSEIGRQKVTRHGCNLNSRPRSITADQAPYAQVRYILHRREREHGSIARNRNQRFATANPSLGDQKSETKGRRRPESGFSSPRDEAGSIPVTPQSGAFICSPTQILEMLGF